MAKNKNEIESRKAEIVENSSKLGLISKPEQYFDLKSGEFMSYKFMIDINTKLKLIFIEKIGFYIFTNRYWKHVEEGFISKIIHSSLQKHSKTRHISEVIKLFKSHVYHPIDVLNKNRNRIVLKNGTLDISDWSNPIYYENEYFIEDYCTIYFNFNYNPDAVHPNFQKYLDSTFEGHPEEILTIQEMFGYCLTTSVKFEKIFILYGEGGTGKSILINTLKTMLTEINYTSTPMSLLDRSFSRAGLKDKLLNFATEETSKALKDSVSAWLKAISSGDPIEAQFKNKDSFNFEPFCKLVFAMNDLPSIANFDEALQRRFIVIKFNKKFRGNDIDLSLKEGKLHSEMDGIFQWALAGLKRLAEQNKFTCSKQSLDMVNTYRLESNNAERFASELIEASTSENYISANELYKRYVDYCKRNMETPFKNPEFSKIVRRRFGLNESREQKKVTINGKPSVIDVFKGIQYKDHSGKVINLNQCI